jgi:hypothetical protein
MLHKNEDKIYILLVPDKVKYKVWCYDFTTGAFDIKKLIDVDLVYPGKSVEVLIPYLSDSKALVLSLMNDMYPPLIRLFKVSAISQQLSTKSTSAKRVIQELAKTPNLLLQALLTHSDVCTIENLINTYWGDFCADVDKTPTTIKRH